MKKLVIIALVAVSGLEAKNHKFHVKMSHSELVSLRDKADNDVETIDVKDGDKIIVTSKELKAVESMYKDAFGYGPAIQDRFSVEAFEKSLLSVRKTGNSFEVKAVNDTDIPRSTTLMIKAEKMVQPSRHMGKMKRTGGQHVKVVIHPK